MEETPPGMDIVALLALPETERQIVQWLLQRGAASIPEITACTGVGLDEPAVQALLANLARKGYLEEVAGAGVQCWQVRLVSSRNRRVPSKVWERLDD